MRVGFAAAQDPRAGGLYQYSFSALEAVSDLAKNGAVAGMTIFAATPKEMRSEWPVVSLDPPTAFRRGKSLARRTIGRWELLEEALDSFRRRQATTRGPVPPPRRRSTLGEWFRQCGADLMLFPTPDARSFESGARYVVAIHDLQHRLQPHFPEVSAGGEWERREYVFGHGAVHAAAVLVDSEVGKEDVLDAYGSWGLKEDSICVVPFLPGVRRDTARELDTHLAYEFPGRYVFYPAQFWPHKNHVRIVEAIGLLASRGTTLHTVFSGSKAGRLRRETYEAVMREASRLGVADQIHFLGYVPDEHLPGLYHGAVALVMPTFFGPTNIPVLEAWEFRCPVITSNLRGIREQVGPAGLLVDPNSSEAVAEAIQRLLDDGRTRDRLIVEGTKRLRSYTPEDHRQRLAAALEVARDRSGIE